MGRKSSNIRVEVKFLGGTDVGGSAQLVTLQHRDGRKYRVLVDFGLHQGWRNKNLNKIVEFNVKKLDAVIITHPHVDHIGRVPLLVKLGYTGPIYMTAEAIKHAVPILDDSANVMLASSILVNNSKMLNAAKNDLLRKLRRTKELNKNTIAKSRTVGFKREVEKLTEGLEYLDKVMNDANNNISINDCLYTHEDVRATISYLKKLDMGQWSEILPGIEVKIVPNGHLYGSTGIAIKAHDDLETFKGIYFSGDVGNSNDILFKAPKPITDILGHTILLESTYGKVNRDISQDEELEKIREYMYDALINRKGKMLFAVLSNGRAQKIAYAIDQIYLRNPGVFDHIPVYMGGTLMNKVSPEYNEESDWVKEGYIQGNIPNFKIINTTMHNIDKGEPKIIISSSGMLNGGASVEYAQKLITDSRNTIILTSYQAEGTGGRNLIESVSGTKVYIGGCYKVKRAQLFQTVSFSSHAFQGELIEYATQMPNLKNIILVHGGKESKEALKEQIELLYGDRFNIIIPELGDIIVMDKYGVQKSVKYT